MAPPVSWVNARRCQGLPSGNCVSSQTGSPSGISAGSTAIERCGVDPAYIPLGLPVWLDTELPDGTTWQRLALAQDTGGAIKGAVRADLFLGQGTEAGRLAGEMKQRGHLYVLMPKLPQPVSALSLR